MKGLGKQFKLLKKREKKPSNLDGADGNVNVGTDKVEPNDDELISSNELEKLISKEAFLRLKESGNGLHMKVC